MGNMEEKLVIIDTDAGVDDAWALFLAEAAKNHQGPGSGKIKILAITSVCGNTTVGHVVQNVTRVLDIVNDKTTPIHAGMSNFLTDPFRFYEDPPYFGYDGFGDTNLPPIVARVENKHAVPAIIKIAEARKGKVTLICLGPLTNLAMAVKLQPLLRTWLKEVYILGGNIAGVGNVGPAGCAEFNFFADPEAAEVVEDSFEGCPITILPWETVLKFQSSYYFRTQVLGNIRTKIVELMNKIEARHLEPPSEYWVNADGMLMACALFQKVSTQISETLRCDVETKGQMTRGMMIIDRNPSSPKPKNIRVIEEINLKLFESLLVWAAGGPAPLFMRSATEDIETDGDDGEGSNSNEVQILVEVEKEERDEREA